MGTKPNCYGYVRVSTKGQNIDRQMKKMRDLEIPVENIYIDKASGANFFRPEYLELRKALNKGDVLFIDSVDRLGRNWKETINEWNYIVHELEADIVSLTDSESFFDSRNFRKMDNMGQLIENTILSTLAFVADSERRKKRDYQVEGIRAARARGQHMGRPKITAEQVSKIISRLSEKLYTIDRISDKTNIPIEIVNRILQHEKPADDTSFLQSIALTKEQVSEVLALCSMRKYSIREIAEDARVSISTVYNYSKTKSTS